ncbi:unnamed protein product, partial [Symbiodinium sp. KB8]
MTPPASDSTVVDKWLMRAVDSQNSELIPLRARQLQTSNEALPTPQVFQFKSTPHTLCLPAAFTCFESETMCRMRSGRMLKQLHPSWRFEALDLHISRFRHGVLPEAVSQHQRFLNLATPAIDTSKQRNTTV